MAKKRKRRGGKRKKSLAKRNLKQRAGFTNRHHMKNACRGGDSSPQNILILDERRHSAWHLLFKNMDFLQVIKLLKRCYEMKTKQKIEE